MSVTARTQLGNNLNIVWIINQSVYLLYMWSTEAKFWTNNITSTRHENNIENINKYRYSFLERFFMLQLKVFHFAIHLRYVVWTVEVHSVTHCQALFYSEAKIVIFFSNLVVIFEEILCNCATFKLHFIAVSSSCLLQCISHAIYVLNVLGY